MRDLFWLLITLVLVFSIVGTIVQKVAGTTAGGIAGGIAVVAYVALWCWIWARDVGAPFFESRSARRQREYENSRLPSRLSGSGWNAMSEGGSSARSARRAVLDSVRGLSTD
jgi:hypothetical protein